MTEQVQPPARVFHHTQQRRITLALLTQGAIDPNNRAIWSGAAAAARDAGVNLICYPGRPMRSPAEFEVQRNIIYRMVDVQTIDGLVFWGLNPWMDLEETYSFIHRFRPMPIVTTGIILDGIPGITADNYHGMYQVVSHLVTVHNRRRIAFIRGPAAHQEAIERFQAYLDVLKENGIAVDDDLIYQGDFKESGGARGARVLLDERKVKFDALVAASDNMALGAMKTFQARGLHIPQDIAIAGVNGEEQGLVITPPLTTAPLHFYEQAYEATMMVLALLHNNEVPLKVILPTRLVVRQSCGCTDPLVSHAQAIPHVEKLDSFTNEIRQLDSLVFGQGSAGLQLKDGETVRQAFPALLKAFLSESRGHSVDTFLNLFAEVLQQTSEGSDSFLRWHEVLSIMRQFAISQLSAAEARLRVENLTQQARVLVGESARRHHAYRALQADEKLRTLGEISQGLNIAATTGELTDMLERALQMLQISRYYLFLYEDPGNPEGLARLIFAYEDNQRVRLEERSVTFPARRLLPSGLLETDRQFFLEVEPLFFREDQLGYAVFEADPHEEAIYEIFGGQISAALKRVILTERNIRLFDEAVVARRTAEQANLLKSRFLATVSHELRTPLTLIVGTIEMMLREEAQAAAQLPASHQKDLRNIRSSAQHLARLIGDVLDLASSQAGELRLSGEPLDLAQTLNEVVLLGEVLAREKELAWRVDLPPVLPRVWGDRTRLKQIVLNLISNATKFTPRGEVALRVTTEASTVKISVSDTGLGIPLEEQEAIFDEFHQSERTTQRGYGGIGLGLAVARRLVELHGGQIGVSSSGREGEGSSFFFTLPILTENGEREDRSEARNHMVLILREQALDPDPLYQHLIRRGFAVETLEIARQPDWMAQLSAAPPGAIVLDLPPAEERGWELVRLLKQNVATQEVPVIFYALSTEQNAGSMFEVDYLTKPVDSAALLRALERQGFSRWESQMDRRILIVDDDPGILDLHTRLVQSQALGCQVLTAANGRQALAVMERERPDLVLLDLMMPEMDGFAVLEMMRRRETLRDIPVIVLTAQILTADDMARLQRGVAVVLEKGLFSASEVLAQISSTLARRKHLGSETQRLVRQTMAYIHERYADPITREELAQRAGVSDRHLSRCFQQEMGVPPMEYLNRYRVQRARALLDQGNVTIAEVAWATGFSDSNYFGRVFRREVGVSPGAYQRGLRS